MVQREQVANPAPLGLLGFGLTTAMLQGANTDVAGGSSVSLTYALAFAYGGAAQFLAGMWEFKRQNGFGATTFSSFGSFWISLALYAVFTSSGLMEPSTDGFRMYLALWGTVTFIFACCTLDLNFALFSLFLTLSMLFYFLTAGVTHVFWNRFAGWWGFVVAGIAIYIAAADLMNEQYKRTVLPLGRWHIGTPMVRGLLHGIDRVPLVGRAYRNACRREDAITVDPVAASKAENGEDVDVAPRRTYGLHANDSVEPSGFEGDNVVRNVRLDTLHSAIGPY